MQQAKTMRTLTIHEFGVSQISWAEKTEIRDDTLYIDRLLPERAMAANPLVKKITVDIIGPAERDVPTNTVMDIMPIAAKADGKLGTGVTHWLSSVAVFLTGVDEDGRQVAELGSSHGVLSEKVQFGVPGTPGARESILRLDVVIARGTGMERCGPIAAHQVCDHFIQEIREVLKTLPADAAVRTEQYEDVRRPDKPRILIIKQVSGQGAMQDKVLLPREPAGMNGGKPIVDLGNVPVMLSPIEIKDGGIHSLT